MPKTDADLQQREHQWRAGQWLRDARKAADISARDFAETLGVTTALLSNYELGRHRFTDERAEQIAQVLHMDLVDVRRNLGLWVPESLAPRPMTPEEAIRTDETLGADQREILLSVVATMRRQPVGPGITEPDDDGPSARPAAPSTL